MSQETTITTDNSLRDDTTVIHIHGDLDSVGTRMIEEQFAQAISNHSKSIIVSLSDVQFISSAGMAMLLVKGKALRQEGSKMYLAGANERVSEVLSLAGFQDLFTMYPSLDEAAAALET